MNAQLLEWLTVQVVAAGYHAEQVVEVWHPDAPDLRATIRIETDGDGGTYTVARCARSSARIPTPGAGVVGYLRAALDDSLD